MPHGQIAVDLDGHLVIVSVRDQPANLSDLRDEQPLATADIETATTAVTSAIVAALDASRAGGALEPHRAGVTRELDSVMADSGRQCVLIRITNTPRPYAWGSTTAIADLLGSAPTGGPEAELWLGGHAGSPARIIEGAPEEDLERWASAHLPDGRLPFLLKVLAAAAPLSLQVHPTAAQARIGFELENRAGVPIDAAERNYRDPWPKPELIVAIGGPFRALCGFRAVTESRADLASVDDSRLTPLIERLVDDESLADAVTWLLNRGPGAEESIAALTAHANAAIGPMDDEPTSWLSTVRLLARDYPRDPGIAISVLMHTVRLAPGEALYLPAGNIHAYLDGVGLELMTASDNVLRGGLTTKHIDVSELLAVLDARPLPVPRLAPHHPAPGIALYAPDGVELALALTEPGALARGIDVVPAEESVILALEGAVEVTDEDASAPHRLERGDAALLVGRRFAVRGAGRIAIASTKLALTAVVRR